jgi:hypothetical protein
MPLAEADHRNAEALMIALASALEEHDADLAVLRAEIAPELTIESAAAAASGAAELLSEAYRELAGGDAPPPAPGEPHRDLTLIPQVITAATPALVAGMVGAALLVYRDDIAGLMARLKKLGITVREGKRAVQAAAEFSASADAAKAKLKPAKRKT